MLAAATVFSLLPLAVELSGGSQAPLLFNVWLRTGATAGCLLFLIAAHRRTILNSGAVRLAVRRLLSPPTNRLAAGVLISTFDFALLAWSAEHMGIATASLIFQTWPVIVVLIVQRVLQDQGIRKTLQPHTLFLTAVSLAGFLVAMASQPTQSAGLAGLRETLTDPATAMGPALALAAIAATSFITLAWRWGRDTAREHRPGHQGHAEELEFTVAIFLTANLASAGGSLVLALTLQGGQQLAAHGWLTATAAGMALAVGNAAWARANLASENPAANAVHLAVPVLTLTWLLLLGQTGEVHTGYLLTGAVILIGANFLIYLKRHQR